MPPDTSPEKLHFREYGDTGPQLVILHGLLGSSGNWQGVARSLAENRRVLVPDLRNHGRSPHHPDTDYHAMASDVRALLQARDMDSVDLVGHSMGGKVAMTLALTRPRRIRSLVVVDMAPRDYPLYHRDLLDALLDQNLSGITSRREMELNLTARVPDPRVRLFIMQNLVRDGDQYRWRVNLSAIAAHLKALAGFPDFTGIFPGPCLFLRGDQSDFITDTDLPVIRRWFPRARISAVAGAGHWVHVDRPKAFQKVLQGFLEDITPARPA